MIAVFLITILRQVSTYTLASMLNDEQERLFENNDKLQSESQTEIKVKDTIEAHKCYVCEHPHILEYLLNFLKHKENIITEFKCKKRTFIAPLEVVVLRINKWEFKNKFKKYTDYIYKKIKATRNPITYTFINSISIYFIDLFDHMNRCIWNDQNAKLEIITMIDHINKEFIHPLILFKESVGWKNSIKTLFTGCFLQKKTLHTDIGKSELYINYETKLIYLLKKHRLKSEKCKNTDDINVFSFIFKGKNESIYNIIYILEVMLKYNTPEIYFVYVFFYYGIKENEKKLLNDKRKIRDIAFNLCIDKKRS